MKTATLQQKAPLELPDKPGKGACPETRRRYRQAALIFYRYLLDLGHKPGEAALLIGVCLRTLHYWRERHRKGGARGLLPRSCAPKRKRKSVIDDARLRDAAVALRNKHQCGGEKLALYLRERGYRISASTAKRLITSLLKEKRITPVLLGKQKKPANGSKSKRAKPALLLSAEQYERAFADELSPGERVQLDTFFVRYNGGQMPVLAAIDVCTRLAWWHPLHELSSHAAGVLLRKVHADFQRLGFGGVGIAQTDGGGEFLGAGFAAVCEELGIRRMVNIPGTPQCGAYIESLHGSARRECINALPRHCTAAQIRAAMAEFEDFYNNKRPHASLGMKSPIMALNDSPQHQRQKCNM